MSSTPESADSLTRQQHNMQNQVVSAPDTQQQPNGDDSSNPSTIPQPSTIQRPSPGASTNVGSDLPSDAPTPDPNGGLQSTIIGDGGTDSLLQGSEGTDSTLPSPSFNPGEQKGPQSTTDNTIIPPPTTSPLAQQEPRAGVGSAHNEAKDNTNEASNILVQKPSTVAGHSVLNSQRATLVAPSPPEQEHSTAPVVETDSLVTDDGDSQSAVHALTARPNFLRMDALRSGFSGQPEAVTHTHGGDPSFAEVPSNDSGQPVLGSAADVGGSGVNGGIGSASFVPGGNGSGGSQAIKDTSATASTMLNPVLISVGCILVLAISIFGGLVVRRRRRQSRQGFLTSELGNQASAKSISRSSMLSASSSANISSGVVRTSSSFGGSNFNKFKKYVGGVYMKFKRSGGGNTDQQQQQHLNNLEPHFRSSYISNSDDQYRSSLNTLSLMSTEPVPAPKTIPVIRRNSVIDTRRGSVVSNNSERRLSEPYLTVMHEEAAASFGGVSGYSFAEESRPLFSSSAMNIGGAPAGAGERDSSYTIETSSGFSEFAD